MTREEALQRIMAAAANALSDSDDLRSAITDLEHTGVRLVGLNVIPVVILPEDPEVAAVDPTPTPSFSSDEQFLSSVGIAGDIRPQQTANATFFLNGHTIGPVQFTMQLPRTGEKGGYPDEPL